MTKSVLVSTVRKFVRENVGGSVVRGFNFQDGIRVGPTFAVMLLLFAVVCSRPFPAKQLREPSAAYLGGSFH